MKKKIVILALIMAAIPLSLFAVESDYYVRTVSLVKVYPHDLGYKVVYMRSNMDLAVRYLPLEWFKGVAGKAEIVTDETPNSPYMSIFWKDGKFDHLRLYVRKDINHPSWGALEPGKDLSAEFSVETLDLEL